MDRNLPTIMDAMNLKTRLRINPAHEVAKNNFFTRHKKSPLTSNRGLLR